LEKRRKPISVVLEDRVNFELKRQVIEFFKLQVETSAVKDAKVAF